VREETLVPIVDRADVQFVKAALDRLVIAVTGGVNDA
jgi:hypothetical protein